LAWLSTFASIVALLVGVATPAAAFEPTTPPNEGSSPTLDTLRSNLESAAIKWLDSEAALATARSEQEKYQNELTAAEAEYAQMRVSVSKYAGEVYKTGPVGVLNMMLSATTQDDFLKKAVAMNRVTQRDEVRLEQLVSSQKRAKEAKAGIDASLASQAQAAAEMAQVKQSAERALAAVGGGATKGWLDPNSRAAFPAPRNADGSWPSEVCSINDPTTSGCITPRTLHAMKEAKDAGFNNYVSCFRSGDRWEHPKGRACDFSATPSGFVDSSAGGENRDYGNRLAAFFVKNGSALGVMYVVWYCQIWHPATGWRAYSSAGSSCGDSPANDHTNHVHVSIY
jgi:hypothetical protein